jgi:DNA replication protein DnaC
MNGRVDIDRTRYDLELLGMIYAAEVLSQFLNTSVKENWAPHRLLDAVIGIELRRREEERIKKWLRSSCLPPGQTLGNFEWTFQPTIKRSQIESLATCAWIREQQTILFQGPPGTGKTHLSVTQEGC